MFPILLELVDSHQHNLQRIQWNSSLQTLKDPYLGFLEFDRILDQMIEEFLICSLSKRSGDRDTRRYV